MASTSRRIQTTNHKLYLWTIEGNWDAISQLSFMDNWGDRLTDNEDTILHVAVCSSVRNFMFLTKLVDKVPGEFLHLYNAQGHNALGVAAQVGNLNAVRILLARDRGLAQQNFFGSFPLIEAVKFGQIEIVLHFLEQSIDEHHFLEDVLDEDVLSLLTLLIEYDRFDLVWTLLRYIPRMATLEIEGQSVLSALAAKTSVCPTNKKSIWKRFFMCFDHPWRNELGEIKIKFEEMRGLVGFICNRFTDRFEESYPEDEVDMASRLRTPFLLAIRNGNEELFDRLLDVYPSALDFKDDADNNVMEMTIIHRQGRIWNLLVHCDFRLHWKVNGILYEESCRQRIMFLVARLQQRKENCDDVLHINNELKWFEALKEMMPHSLIGEKDSDGKTPIMVFEEEHASLIDRAMKWYADASTRYCVLIGFLGSMAFPILKEFTDDNCKDCAIQKDKIYYNILTTIALGAKSLVFFTSMFRHKGSKILLFKVQSQCFIGGMVFMILNMLMMLITLFSILRFKTASPHEGGIVREVLLGAIFLLVFYFHIPLLVESINSGFCHRLEVGQQSRMKKVMSWIKCTYLKVSNYFGFNHEQEIPIDMQM